MKTIAIFWPSPMPSQSIVNGIHVIEGNGRNKDTKGSTAALAGAQTAMMIPSGIATAPASAKPSTTRCVDIQMSLSNCPLARFATPSLTTRPGLGRNTGEIHPRSVEKYHRARTDSTDKVLTISRKAGLRLFFLARAGATRDTGVPSAERTPVDFGASLLTKTRPARIESET